MLYLWGKKDWGRENEKRRIENVVLSYSLQCLLLNDSFFISSQIWKENDKISRNSFESIKTEIMGWWNANQTKVQILDYRQIAPITLHDQLIVGYYFIIYKL